MSRNENSNRKNQEGAIAIPKCLAFFGREGGVSNSQQFIRGFSVLLGDIVAGRISHKQANAVANAGSKMLKAAELEQKYGIAKVAGGRPGLEFIGPYEKGMKGEK